MATKRDGKQQPKVVIRVTIGGKTIETSVAGPLVLMQGEGK